MDNSIQIDIPKGYILDIENTDFQKGIVKLKKVKIAKNWEDLGFIEGFRIDSDSEIIKLSKRSTLLEYNKNIFASEKYAKSALAFAQLSQVYEFGDYNIIDYKVPTPYAKYYIIYNAGDKKYYPCGPSTGCSIKGPFTFKTKISALEFIENNKDLLDDYYMVND